MFLLGHLYMDDIKMGLEEVEWRAWTGLILLMIGTGGRLL